MKTFRLFRLNDKFVIQLLVIERKKHILYISSWYPNRLDPFNGDFVQRHGMAISRINKVSVLHVEGDPNIQDWQFESKDDNDHFTELYLYFPKSNIPIINFLRKIQGLSKGRKRIGKVDLIHANVLHYHFVWLLFQSLPYIITEHATQYHRLHDFPYTWLKKIIFKLIFKRAKAVLPVSLHLGKKLEALFGKLPLVVIPNVVDTKEFHPIDTTNPYFSFLHLSNLSAVKNISGILEAINEVHKRGYRFKFEIGGNGKTDLIEAYRTQNNLQEIIEVLPALSHEQVAARMRTSDCFVLFSDFENQPCVLSESMACGLPFISTKVGGVEEFFVKDSCILIQKRNIGELAEAMIAMIEGTIQPNKPELVAYAHQNFSTERISQKINEIYNECLIDIYRK